MSRFICALIAAALLFQGVASAQPTKEAAILPAQITIRADRPKNTIPREIYGQFAEHLGRLVYDGLWVGPDSKIPNTRGIRNDILEALKRIGVPVLRWPGGCFADEYHWRDGIGPPQKRPKRINTHWGMVIEDNSFGTHEFLDLCEQIGAEPYVSANVGTGTPQEMMEWVEYMTSDSDSTLANERRANGREKPWKIKYIGVGNESWGCGGNMRPEFYADLYRQYSTFVKNYPGSHIQKIACGANGEDYNWTDVVMNQLGNRRMNGISLHWYTLPTGNWQHKGAATGFPSSEWDSTIRSTYRMDDIIAKHLAMMDKYDADHHVGLVVDEWGAWYDQEPGTHPGFLYQQSSIRDAVVAGINLNIFNNRSDRVMMANLAQMVNVLQALILTDKDRMILTPTYWVFEMYKVHQGATLLPTETQSADYAIGDAKIPSVITSASKDESGKIHLSVVNARPDRATSLTVNLSGATVKRVTGQTITADATDAHNTFDQPDAVKPSELKGIEATGDKIHVMLPAKSVSVLEIQ